MHCGPSDKNNRIKRSRLHLFCLRLAAMMLGLLPFGMVELFLRVFDLPSQAFRNDPFLDCSQLYPLFEESSDGVYRIPLERLRLFAPAEFSSIKATNTTRVFSLGESTTQGEPYGPPTAFSAWLEINLALLAPNRKWEMINCGGLSYASYRVLPIVREVLEYDPDLIVVYCGQNEFLEARELNGWKQTPTAWVRMISPFYRLRLVQFAGLGFKPTRAEKSKMPMTQLKCEVDALLDSQGGLEKYHRDTLDAPAVVASFRWNLEQMIEACNKRHVPIVLVVPTVNLRDCPPFKIEINPQLDSDDCHKVEFLWNQIQNNEAHPEEIVEGMKRILAIDSQHAGAHYYLGKQAIAARDWEAARRHLRAAKDYDVCPLRATSEIQQSILDVAVDGDVPVLDADQLFQAQSPHGIVGYPWLIDHVHPSIEGHQLIGDALAELLVKIAFVKSEREDWRDLRVERYREHLSKLGDAYFIRGQQRLEGLLLWTQGRAKKLGTSTLKQ